MSTRRRRTTKRPPAAAPFVQDLVRQGWSRRDAEHLAVVDLALSTVDIVGSGGPAALATLAGHAATALRWPAVLGGAQMLYADQEHAPAWRALAAVTRDAGDRDLFDRLAALSDGADISAVPIAEALSAEDLRLYDEAQRAEARGQFSEAADLLRRSARPLHDAWLTDLEHMTAHGDTLTPARWGRFIASMAQRWVFSTRLGLERGPAYGRVALEALGAPPERIAELAVERCAYDQMVHDALLFDEGGLAAYLELELAPAVRDRAPGIAAWPTAAPRLVLLESREADGGLCTDLVHGGQVLVGDAGLADEHPAGRCFTGRLVQVDGDERHWFALKPTVVEGRAVELLADALAQDVPATERLAAMHRGLRLDLTGEAETEPEVPDDLAALTQEVDQADVDDARRREEHAEHDGPPA